MTRSKSSRLAVGAALAVLILAWMASVLDQAREAARWDAAAARGPAALLESGIAPATSTQRLENAKLLADRRFPPQWAAARAELESAIALAPFRPEQWLALSRIALFAGGREPARAALAVADRLDPHSLAPRVRSMQLRLLLGERAEAEQLARELLRLDRTLLPHLVEQLLAGGVGAVPAMEILCRGAEDPALWIDVLEELPRGRQSEAVFATLPESVLSGEEACARLTRLAVEAGAFVYLAGIAQVDTSGAWQVTGGTLAPNPDLARPPFATARAPLGWREATRNSPFVLVWQPGEPGVTTPTLTLQPTVQSRGETLAWEAYRFASLGTGAVRVTLPVRSATSGGARAWLTLAGGGQSVRSEWLALAPQWGTLDAIIQTDSPRVMSVRLDARASHAAPIEVGPLTIEAAWSEP